MSVILVRSDPPLAENILSRIDRANDWYLAQENISIAFDSG